MAQARFRCEECKAWGMASGPYSEEAVEGWVHGHVKDTGHVKVRIWIRGQQNQARYYQEIFQGEGHERPSA